MSEHNQPGDVVSADAGWDSARRTTKIALLALFVLALATWFMPCAGIPVALSSLEYEYHTKLVIGVLFPPKAAHHVYLMLVPFAVPFVLAIERLKRIAALVCFLASAAILVVNCPLVPFWWRPMSVFWFSLTFHFIFTPETVLLFGYYLYLGTILAIGLLFLVRGVMWWPLPMLRARRKGQSAA